MLASFPGGLYAETVRARMSKNSSRPTSSNKNQIPARRIEIKKPEG